MYTDPKYLSAKDILILIAQAIDVARIFQEKTDN